MVWQDQIVRSSQWYGVGVVEWGWVIVSMVYGGGGNGVGWLRVHIGWC